MRFSLSVRADECSINVFIEMFERTEAGFLRVTHLLCAAVEIEISGLVLWSQSFTKMRISLNRRICALTFGFRPRQLSRSVCSFTRDGVK